MEHRLGRTLRVFLVVLAAAGCYRLVVVPLVEPRLPDLAASAALSPEAAAAIRARADQRLTALSDVFPEGAWERDSPIMLESRQMRLLFKDYHSLPDGRVNLVPCTLVVLPDRNRSAAAAASGRTIVMRAPQGAVLEFDEPLDLRQGRLARLIGGNLRGQVTIRGTPSEPTGEDEIEIVTRDIMLDEYEVRTAEMVQFRYGRSSGSGRGLVAQLTPREAPAEHGPNFGGVDSIRLDRDVRMRIEERAGGGLLPGRTEAAATGQPPEPVLVSCRGSLCLNVSAHVITLEDQVDIVRAGQGTAGDRLTCDLLAILLARRSQPQADEAAGGPLTEGSHGGLEPTEIQAKGSPAVVTSLAAGVEARAARLGYEIATRRIVLDGEEPVSLVMRESELEARKIDYTPGPPGDPGQLLAVGPGRLLARSEGGPPVRARWQQWLRLRPDGGGHVASLLGAAEVDVEAQGRLAAAEMHLWLDVLPSAGTGDAARLPTDEGSPLAGVRPSRLLARSDVEVEADQAEVRTDRLEIWFRDDPAAVPVAPAAPPAEATAAAPPEAPPPAAANSPGPREPADREPRGRFAATATLVRGLVLRSGSGGQLDELSMEGEVRLLEMPDPADPEAPAAGIEILGDQLHLARAQRPDARAVVSGRPARVQGRDLDLEGPLVTFDRGRGRFAVDGAGRLALPLTGAGIEGLQLTEAARPAAAAEPGRLDVTWQGRMEFDGLTARFLERVVADGGSATVRAAAIDVVFDRPFDFAAGPAAGGPRPEVARIACGGGVRVESESNSADGGRSQERLHARDLFFDRATGDILGNGPGRLTSTRSGSAPGFELAVPTGGIPGQRGSPRPPQSVSHGAAPQAPDGLSYLGVDFQRGLRGNMHRRQVEFHQRVEAIWGPVAGWSDTLDPHASGGLPPRTFTVSSDVLGVGQAPPLPGRPRGSLELEAGGNVLVEGESFTARSARLSWSEAKDLLVFAGDGRSDAQLFRQVQPGAAPSTASAGRILFWRELNRVEVEDARFLDFDQLRGGGPVPDAWGGRPAPPRSPPAT